MLWNNASSDYNNAMAVSFSHDELPIKQEFLKTAQKLYADSADNYEKALAAALIYMNIADYLAEYLLNRMNQLANEAVSTYYIHAIAYTPQQKDGLNIGESMRGLQAYKFLKKAQIMGLLEVINTSRNIIAHEMVKTRGDRLLVIDEAVQDLVQNTEELIAIVDQVGQTFPPTNLVEQYQTIIDDRAPKPKPKTKKGSKAKKKKQP